MTPPPPAPPPAAPPQRLYRAACPNCGAPVEFRSVASAFAVCSFCRSTLVRDGDALRRTGESAELFDDHSPLQLGAGGRFQGEPFTLVGRLQYRTDQGTWNEWHALFDSGRSAWLSEDNGRYVLGVDIPLQSPVPPAEALLPGAQQSVDGRQFAVASVTVATLSAVQGELPQPPFTARSFYVVDLRSPQGDVGTLDYSNPARPGWSVGRSVALAELRMTGLAEPTEKTLSARGFACPNCGAALEITLATTQSIVCRQCRSVIDLTSAGPPGSAGETAAALAHYAQDNGSEPLIPLGSVGRLALGSPRMLPWQVVGYVERCEVPRAGDNDGNNDDDGDHDSDQTFWREYLVYNRTEGFAFIVDAEDGWSWTAPITGVPSAAGATIGHDGITYRRLYDYTGEVTYVLGEFYWQVTRRQRTRNSDWVGIGNASAKRLNSEATETPATATSAGSREVVWSAGETLTSGAIQAAFRLPPDASAALQRDAAPTAFSPRSLTVKLMFWVVVAIVLLMLWRCSSGGHRDCSDIASTYGDTSGEYRSCLAANRGGGGTYIGTGGGSFGGYSSGGSHK